MRVTIRSLHGRILAALLALIAIQAAAAAQQTADQADEGDQWFYYGGFSFFGQYVDQDLAGLDRTGIEAEVAWTFDLPLKWTVGGRQLFSHVTPAVRFSELDPDFVPHPRFPAPSVVWDWQKIDVGVRLAVVRGFDVTAEYQDNRFIVRGREESNDEFLATLRLAFRRPWG